MQPDKYKWDGDSRDERESEFSETSFSTTRASGFHSTFALDRTRRKRKARLNRVLLIVLVALLLSAAVLYAFARRVNG